MSPEPSLPCSCRRCRRAEHLGWWVVVVGVVFALLAGAGVAAALM